MEEIWHLATQLVFRFPPVFQLSAIWRFSFWFGSKDWVLPLPIGGRWGL
jgi:hypothetical protein